MFQPSKHFNKEEPVPRTRLSLVRETSSSAHWPYLIWPLSYYAISRIAFIRWRINWRINQFSLSLYCSWIKRNRKIYRNGNKYRSCLLLHTGTHGIPNVLQTPNAPTFPALTSRACPSLPKGSGLLSKADLVHASLQLRVMLLVGTFLKQLY